MALYMGGDEAAFRELFFRYKSRVYAYVLRATRNERVADDLFQVVFLKLHRSRAGFDGTKLFAAWLFAICRNVVRDYAKKEKARPELAVEEPELEVTPIPAEDQSLEATWSSAVEKLPPREKRAIELRYGKSLAFSQMARELGTTETNARQIVSRALRKLKSLFNE